MPDSTKDVMPYSDLAYVDAVDQPVCHVGTVNALKQPLRTAINRNRMNTRGMVELIHLLETSLAYIKAAEPKPKRKRKPKTEIEVDFSV